MSTVIIPQQKRRIAPKSDPPPAETLGLLRRRLNLAEIADVIDHAFERRALEHLL
jgi:hypothetical protein